MAQRRNFYNEPAGSTLHFVVASDPDGSCGASYSLAVDGVEVVGPTAADAGRIYQVGCNQAPAVYAVQVSVTWIADGDFALACWLRRPNGEQANRHPILLRGIAADFEICLLTVTTVAP